MFVIKKGKLVEFEQNKIRNAIIAAWNQVGMPNFKQVNEITRDITEELVNWNENIPVEEIENLVMSYLYRLEPEVARSYSAYKIKREQQIENPSEIDKVLLNSLEVSQENANKNTQFAHIKNAYLAEIPSKQAMREALPADCLEAHDRGAIHFHDSSYSIRPIHNCFDVNTKFITSDGLKSFADFRNGDRVSVLSLDGQYHNAIVKSFGKQKLYRYTFYNLKKEHTHDVLATENHRWILKDGKETTNLSIGDKLIKPPVIYKTYITDEEFFELNENYRERWCQGFALGDGVVEWNYHADGTKEFAKRTHIRLCGKKNKYLNRLLSIKNGKKRNTYFDNGDQEVVIFNYQKEIPDFNDLLELQCFINGLYCADGRTPKKNNNSKIIQSSNNKVIDFIRQYADTAGFYITSERDYSGRRTNLATRGYTISFSFNPDFHCSYTVKNKEFVREDEVWCLQVEDSHNFILEWGIPTGNCELLNLDELLQNGCEINSVWIEKPKSFRTACTVATQVLTHVAGNTYGGCTINLLHLAKFVDLSRQKIRRQVMQEISLLPLGISDPDYLNDKINQIVNMRLNDEIAQGMQTFQYQTNTLCSSVGQAVFLTVSVYLNEDPKYTDDLILIFKEMLRQRIQGLKNKNGVYENPNFPKILYMLDEDTMEGGKYYDVTRLCAECSAKRLVPDYMSVKKHMELKGVVTPSMGKRKLQPISNFSNSARTF